MTNEELLKAKVERQKRQIELLEELIESRSRDIFTINEELAATNAALSTSLDELKAMQRALVDASRRAGMADVATSVLHNVGNVLNSVNVSATVLHELLRTTKAGGVAKAVALLRAQPDPGRFLTDDPRGKKLLDYLDGVVAAMEADGRKASSELKSVERNLEHIRAVVMTQQANARPGGAVERVDVPAALDEALRMAAAAIEGQSIEIVRDYAGLDGADAIFVDRHKLFQILVNLLTNAAHALKPRSGERRIRVEARSLLEGDHVEIRVSDNGVGIPPENLTKIFGHGFTTRTDGHGFGLHSCANAAGEMGGRLEAASGGPGEGATFTLVIPRTGSQALEGPISSRGRRAVSASP